MPVESGPADQRSVHVPPQGCTAQGRPPQGRPASACGDVDLSTRDRFAQMLSMMCANARGDVHLDLAELHFVDVAGVGALIRAAGELTAPARLVLHNPPEAMIRTLELTWPDYPEHGILLT
jgi:anti-anti-sigma factor